MRRGISQPVDPLVVQAIQRASDVESWRLWAQQPGEEYSGAQELPLYVPLSKPFLRHFIKSLLP